MKKRFMTLALAAAVLGTTVLTPTRAHADIWAALYWSILKTYCTPAMVQLDDGADWFLVGYRCPWIK